MYIQSVSQSITANSTRITRPVILRLLWTPSCVSLREKGIAHL